MRTRLGFTIIELMVTIGVISLLLSLALPAVGTSIARGRAAVCLSNVRQLSLTTSLYAESFESAYPYALHTNGFWVTPGGKSTLIFPGAYFALGVYWTTPLGAVADWRESYRSWVCPNAKRSRGEPWLGPTAYDRGGVSYTLSHGFFARPETWSSDQAIADADQLLRPVFVHEVSLPASKVLFYDSEAAHLMANSNLRVRPMVFADGHASELNIDRSLPAARNRLTGTSLYLRDTEMGVRGIDYR